ncbi:PhoH family protein [methanotrophic endosymbiont of Bathymodiolus puteoserpentis (Logatchev)]|uniref:PhoH family protein n=1 Tax=methanotrophic endosymbiont of Bathymodiolus puteoserpentis (Logatchev) TaxID=343235 RepID=UPI0013C6C517|nr:PhoH family protein [methanotrophic endosymbiont of Bathymodiolus puteoserpentis (Logatchev)]SHE19884.1 Phosphate starvation-inducible protein PhoH, predicted ATPase [methanotrophic endosymbiont of Bathymodiolus puteoserpentis (Logatchev)]
MSTETLELILEPADNQRLANLCGEFNGNLQQIEQRLQVEIANRGNQFNVSGTAEAVKGTGAVLNKLFIEAEHEEITPEHIHLSMQDAHIEDIGQDDNLSEVFIKTKRGVLKGRGANQKDYLRRILNHDINFGIGPAGTGKTYLAVACAVEALQSEQVRRIVLVRPAVEAGEKLGFLPGDMAQKVDPYLRPLYDALYEMLGFERAEKLIERKIIEVAPLAFMRGRTLNDSFIILDEAQNTTTEQIKMFLTRVGFGSTAVITGDITQIDLPNEKMSGLKHVLKVLDKVEGISFTFFGAKDIVRHPLVQRIVIAYENYERAHS